MQSSHDVLRQNILSNWFATSSLSKQLHQASFFGQDTDVIYLHSCDLNTKFDFTVPSLQFLWLTVVFGQFVFVSSLVKRRQHMLPTNRQNFGLTRRREISIHCTGYGESSKESSVFFLWAKESFSLWHCSSRNSTLFASRWGAWPVLKCNQGSDVLENFEVHLLRYGQGNYFFKRKFMYL